MDYSPSDVGNPFIDQAIMTPGEIERLYFHNGNGPVWYNHPPFNYRDKNDLILLFIYYSVSDSATEQQFRRMTFQEYLSVLRNYTLFDYTFFEVNSLTLQEFCIRLENVCNKQPTLFGNQSQHELMSILIKQQNNVGPNIPDIERLIYLVKYRIGIDDFGLQDAASVCGHF